MGGNCSLYKRNLNLSKECDMTYLNSSFKCIIEYFKVSLLMYVYWYILSD